MQLIKKLASAIKRVREPRLFKTERGYQGKLATEIDRLLGKNPRLLVEQEYQKTADAHGITLRPDIILHIPFERGVSPSRRHANHLVILLKRSASQKLADEDFAKLSIICSKLDYPIGAFININSANLWLPHYSRMSVGNFDLHEFAIVLRNGQPQIQSYRLQFREKPPSN